MWHNVLCVKVLYKSWNRLFTSCQQIRCKAAFLTICFGKLPIRGRILYKYCHKILFSYCQITFKECGLNSWLYYIVLWIFTRILLVSLWPSKKVLVCSSAPQNSIIYKLTSKYSCFKYRSQSSTIFPLLKFYVKSEILLTNSNKLVGVTQPENVNTPVLRVLAKFIHMRYQ